MPGTFQYMHCGLSLCWLDVPITIPWLRCMMNGALMRPPEDRRMVATSLAIDDTAG